MMRGRELLERRFTSGEDTRAAGVVMEVEARGAQAVFQQGALEGGPVESTFIGKNVGGDHVRVYSSRGRWRRPRKPWLMIERPVFIVARPRSGAAAARLADPRAGRASARRATGPAALTPYTN